MKEIPLHNSKLKCYVDDDDYDRLVAFKWGILIGSENVHKLYYAYRSAPFVKNPNRVVISMHRDVIACPTRLVVDHIDGNGLNNQKANLRAVTIRQNQINRHAPTANEYPCAKRVPNGSWVAQINVGKIIRKLGYFKDAKSASDAYMMYAKIADYAVTHITRECCCD